MRRAGCRCAVTEFELSNLRVNAVNAVVRTVDWSEYKDPDRGMSWDSYEAVTCEKCGQAVVLNGGGDLPHCDADPDAVLPPCTISSHHGGLGSCEDCAESTGDEGLGVCMCDDAPCDGHLPSADGPMMNYLYPCPLNDVSAAAIAIRHLPLCVVEFADGETGFALTGGGMDFSWEICAAYVACGYLPPTDFDLPKMGGMSLTGWHRDVWRAMRRSIEVQQNWLTNSLTKLDELKQWLEDKDAKSKAAARAREDAR